MVNPSLRVRVVRMFVDIAHLPLASAISIDECIIARCHDRGVYAREATRICHNMMKNPSLSVMETRELCSLTNDEALAPEMRRYTEDEASTAIMVQSMLKEKYASISANTTGVLTCRVCKGSDVSFQQKQTRGADEAMTIFCICVCGARWKMS